MGALAGGSCASGSTWLVYPEGGVLGRDERVALVIVVSCAHKAVFMSAPVVRFVTGFSYSASWRFALERSSPESAGDATPFSMHFADDRTNVRSVHAMVADASRRALGVHGMVIKRTNRQTVFLLLFCSGRP